MGTKRLLMEELSDRRPLAVRIADDLRERLAHGEWEEGEQLPTEADLVEAYRVSRVTVREALKSLEAQGLIIIRRGRGSFAVDGSQIRAGLQELTSITTTIREMGHEPGMIYHHRTLREATEAEVQMFELEEGTEVLEVQRKILSDGVVVAYSYDVLPRWVFPTTFDPHSLTGSVFAYLAEHRGPVPLRALAQVHAVINPDAAWDDDVPGNQLYVLIDQLHYADDGRPFMHTKSYFIEGRFSFSVVRTAPKFR